jgi:ATP:ADP antiporter, AAA family
MTINTTADTANSTATTSQPKWSWADARRTLFPIYGEKEVTKFLLIGSIKFFIILALTLTRDTKDTLVVTQCGAEAIAFLKVRVVVLEKLQKRRC